MSGIELMGSHEGALHFFTESSGECRGCHVMRHFWVQREDDTRCLYCDEGLTDPAAQAARQMRGIADDIREITMGNALLQQARL